jgi:NADH-ubiquinone oxidoreductase chain 5
MIIIFLPLISSIISGMFSFTQDIPPGKLSFKKGTTSILENKPKIKSDMLLMGYSFFGAVNMLFTAALSYYAFYEVGLQKNMVTIEISPWIYSDLFCVNWSFLFDSLTVTMLVVVNTVSALVHVYSIRYMEGDPHFWKFTSYLSLFTFFMIILVTADNFLQLFLGWEGVGLCSFLLISFWHTRIQANKAAIKAMVINRVGDFALLVAIVFIYFTFRSIDYATVFALSPFFLEKQILIFSYNFKIINVICFLLFIGSVGKSAQVGLHTWLPDAMEGPTPVSALIHAATMVTAGIFLIIRCSPLFEYSPYILNIITLLGGLTAFFSATIGLVQNDIKKIIAYSTCSQLGYMTFVCGTSNYAVSLFHLSNHAFFKALLFLGAGAVIHGLGNEQDIRKMGGLSEVMPFTYSVMLVGSLSLAGFPFLSGFYSKDVILELVYVEYTVGSLFSFWLGTLTAFFTAIYSFRLLYLVFLNKRNSYKKIFIHAHELPITLAVPLFILSFGSIFTGYLTKDIFIGFGSTFFGDAIFVLPKNLSQVDAEFIPYSIKLLPTVCSSIGIILSLFCYNFFEFYLVYFRLNYYFLFEFYKFLIHKWYFDFIQNKLIGLTVLNISYTSFLKIIDKGFLEILGPTGIANSSTIISYKIKKMQTGYIYQYTCLMLFYFILMITFIDIFMAESIVNHLDFLNN